MEIKGKLRTKLPCSFCSKGVTFLDRLTHTYNHSRNDIQSCKKEKGDHDQELKNFVKIALITNWINVNRSRFFSFDVL